MEGEKSQKAAPKGPASAVLAERMEFMAVLDPQQSSKETLEPTSLLMLLGGIIPLVSLHYTKNICMTPAHGLPAAVQRDTFSLRMALSYMAGSTMTVLSQKHRAICTSDPVESMDFQRKMTYFSNTELP